MHDPIRELAVCCVRDDDPLAFLALLDLLEERQDPRVLALRRLDFTAPLKIDRVFGFRNTIVCPDPDRLVVLHSALSWAGRRALLRGAVVPINFWDDSTRERLLNLRAVGPASFYAVDPEGRETADGWVPSAREAAGNRLLFSAGLMPRRPQLDDCWRCRHQDHASVLVSRSPDTPFDVRREPRDLYRAVLMTQFPHLADELRDA